MLHPDYQYTPKLMMAMASMVAVGHFDVVLASRILSGGALAGGMPIYKYLSNRVLTAVENLVTGAKLSEYHTGYRAFSRQVLETLPLEENSDDFVFDAQMLAQCHLLRVPGGRGQLPDPLRRRLVVDQLRSQREVRPGRAGGHGEVPRRQARPRPFPDLRSPGPPPAVASVRDRGRPRPGRGPLMTGPGDGGGPAGRLPQRLAVVRRALSWRGPDGQGLPLHSWVAVLALVWLALRLWPQTAGFAASGTFFLGLAVLVPVLQTLARDSRALPLRPGRPRGRACHRHVADGRADRRGVLQGAVRGGADRDQRSPPDAGPGEAARRRAGPRRAPQLHPPVAGGRLELGSVPQPVQHPGHPGQGADAGSGGRLAVRLFAVGAVLLVVARGGRLPPGPPLRRADRRPWSARWPACSTSARTSGTGPGTGRFIGG